MTIQIALFEIKKKLQQISTYVYFGIFFLITFLAVLSAGGAFMQDGVRVGGSGGKVMINSPIVLFVIFSGIHQLGMIITAAVMGQAVYQDFHHRTFTMFYTSPINKLQYLLGRFLGSFVILVFIFSSMGFGAFFGTLWPTVDQELFGENHLESYVRPYLISIIPNTLLTGTLFFSLAALTRMILPVYTGSVVLLIGYLMSTSLLQEIDSKELAGWIDPFGTAALSKLANYWTAVEQNTLQIPLTGLILGNRVLWLSVALVIWVATYLRFKTNYGGERRGGGRSEGKPALSTSKKIPITEHRDLRALRQLPGLTWLNFKETVKNVYFSVIVLAGVLFLIMATQLLSALYGTETYPITALIAELTGGGFGLFMLIIITFYSGEVVWRERDANVHLIMDVLPIPDWLPMVAKLMALIMIQVLLAAVIMLTGIGVQVAQSYFHFELGVYFKELFLINLARYTLISILALTIQTLIVNKYAGHVVMILFYLVDTFSGQFGIEHNLFKYGRNPGFTYSDMNGFGSYVRGILWYDFYWFLWALLMVLVCNLFWVRGVDFTRKSRWELAKQRFRTAHGVIASVLLLAIICTAGWIYYNTCVVNRFQTAKARNKWAVAYEKKYRELRSVPQPRITAVKVNMDLYPETLKLHSDGEMVMINKTSQPIEKIYVEVPAELTYKSVTLDGKNSSEFDKEFGLYTFALSEPLSPGAEAKLAFELDWEAKGFVNSGDRSALVKYNGTFLNSEIFPSLGYNDGREISEEQERRRQGLEVRPRMPKIDDVDARKNTYIKQDSDWVSLESTVSTSPDQIAIVPGYLQKEWNENGRRYFKYKTDGRILNFFSVLSARYEVRRDVWRGKVSFGKLPPNADDGGKPLSVDDRAKLFEGSDEDVNIEIYYHKGHEYNIDAMVQGIKASLDYYTTNFGPYQHRQVRILEFPRYAQFAQSFPNTIPYSEAIGFVARVDPKDPKDVDFPYYVTAHEIAHQWWAHQVIGANVQGATLMSETLSQYSALMVMKRKVGDAQMRRFLQYELDRYLSGRALEREKEQPLALNENQQYIHYNKGSMVMYCLQDVIGEERVNRALARYVRQVAYQEPPYTISTELVDILREETPEEYRYLIEDMFDKITLFENRTLEASYEAKGDKFEVTFKVLCKKVRPDETGNDQDIDADDWIDIGVLDSKGEPLALEKRRMKSGEATYTMTVDKIPAKAGIDPLSKLIDRTPSDNTASVSKK